jgi:PRTRC genetic system protein E
MFTELAPVLKDRLVTLSILHIKDEQFQISIVPKTLKEGENKALTEAFSLKGTLAELDAELPAAILKYATGYAELNVAVNALDAATKAQDEAKKALQKEAEEKRKAKVNGKTVPPAPPTPPKKPTPPSLFADDSPAPTASTPAEPVVSLFDNPAPASVDAPASEESATTESEDDIEQSILEEIEEGEEEQTAIAA